MTTPKELKDMENFNDKRNMTNKLPIVKRYRLKNRHNYIVEVLPILTVKTLQDGTGSVAEYGIKVFNDIFEELPEDNSQQAGEAKEPQICKIHGNLYPSYCTKYNDDGSEQEFVVCDKCMKGENAIDKAKEELRAELIWWRGIVLKLKSEEFFQNVRHVTNKAQALLDVLDAEKASSEANKQEGSEDANGVDVGSIETPELTKRLDTPWHTCNADCFCCKGDKRCEKCLKCLASQKFKTHSGPFIFKDYEAEEKPIIGVDMAQEGSDQTVYSFRANATRYFRI